MKKLNFNFSAIIQILIVTIFVASLGMVFFKPGIPQQDPFEIKLNELESRLVQLEKVLLILEE